MRFSWRTSSCTSARIQSVGYHWAGGLANAGAGGNGGNGGALGAAGSNGTNGGGTSSASRTPGQGGDGGAAGVAIKNDGATWTNSGGGTYNGAYT